MTSHLISTVVHGRCHHTTPTRSVHRLVPRPVSPSRLHARFRHGQACELLRGGKALGDEDLEVRVQVPAGAQPVSYLVRYGSQSASQADGRGARLNSRGRDFSDRGLGGGAWGWRGVVMAWVIGIVCVCVYVRLSCVRVLIVCGRVVVVVSCAFFRGSHSPGKRPQPLRSTRAPLNSTRSTAHAQQPTSASQQPTLNSPRSTAHERLSMHYAATHRYTVLMVPSATFVTSTISDSGMGLCRGTQRTVVATVWLISNRR